MRSGRGLLARAAVSTAAWSILAWCAIGFAPAAFGQSKGDQAAPKIDGARNTRVLAEILSLAPPDVIPALVKAIRDDPQFADPHWKHQAYSVLVSLNGVDHPAGLRQFILGLRDPIVGCQCIYALSTAPPDRYDQVAPALKMCLDWLLGGYVLPCPDTLPLFDAIATLGRAGRGVSGSLGGVLSDSAAPVTMRGAAAKALFSVSGVVHYLDVVRPLLGSDSLGARIALHALLIQGEKERWAFIKKSEDRAALTALLSGFLNVRPARSFGERLKLGSDSKIVVAESAVLAERIEFGATLLESIARAQPQYARDLMTAWMETLRPVASGDPSFSVRLKATEKLYQAGQRLTYLD